MKLRPLARPFLLFKIQSGNEAIFWHDNLTSLGPLIDITGTSGPRVAGISLFAKVTEAINEGLWSFPHGRHPLLLLIRHCLPFIAPILDHALQDSFL